jgi:hypothetical protein
MAPSRLSDSHTHRGQSTLLQPLPEIHLRFNKWKHAPVGRATWSTFPLQRFTEHVEDMNAAVPFGGDVRQQLNNTLP